MIYHDFLFMFGEPTKLPSSPALVWHRLAGIMTQPAMPMQPVMMPSIRNLNLVRMVQKKQANGSYSHCHPDQPCKPRI